MKFKVHVIPICPGLVWTPNDLHALGPSVEDIFWRASGHAIELEITCQDPVYPTELSAVTKSHLRVAFDIYVHNQADQVHDLAVIIAPRWDYKREIYGIMFDADLPFSNEVGTILDLNSNHINREGVAIFVGALQEAGFRDARYTARTMVHELGHVFNLPHDPAQGSFMATTTRSLPSSAFSQFRLGEQMFLAECEHSEHSEYVRPGGAAFGERGELALLVR